MTSSIRPKMGKQNVEKLPDTWVGYISDVDGRALINRHTKDGSTILMTFQAEKGDLIHEQDAVETGKIGSVELTLKNKTEVFIGPKTIFEMRRHHVTDTEQNSVFNLLYGSVRITTQTEKEKFSVKLLSTSAVINTNTKQVDFVTIHDAGRKTVRIACLEGEINVLGFSDNKERKTYSQYLAINESMSIATSYDGDREIYLNTDPVKISRNDKKKLLDEFETTPKSLDPWTYERLGSSAFRFTTALDYTTVRELSSKRYYNLALGYIPLIHLGSIFYLEPYFYMSFASLSNLLLRGGIDLELYLWRGFYLGSGAGLFSMSNGGSGSLDFNINLGYSFAEKQMGLFEGFRFSYFISKTSIYNIRSVMFSLIFNFASLTDTN